MELEVAANIRDVILTSASGEELVCSWADFRTSASSRSSSGMPRVLLYFHGNGESASESAAMWAEDYEASMGLDGCFFAEYRGYGKSQGQASLCDMQADLPRIMAEVKSRIGGPMDLFVYGRSIGSISALAFAAMHAKEVQGLILESGIAKVEQWVVWYCDRSRVSEAEVDLDAFMRKHGVDPTAARACAQQHLNSEIKLAAYRGPLLVLHTEGDRVVPPEHAREFHRLASKTERDLCRLVVWPRGGHNDIHAKNEAAYLHELQDFVEKALASKDACRTNLSK